MLLFLFGWLLAQPVEAEGMVKNRRVVAHRGASHFAPEQTKPAIQLAAYLNPDCIEFDVQRTKDGVLVVFHDSDFTEKTNATELFGSEKAELAVEEWDYQDLIKLDAGTWFNRAYPDRARESFKGLKILTMEELLDLAVGENGDRVPLCVELKRPKNFPGIEKEIVDLLKKLDWIDKKGDSDLVYFLSFNGESIARLTKLAPGTSKVKLERFVLKRLLRTSPTDIIKKAKKIGANSVGYGKEIAVGNTTRMLQDAGLDVFVYTINDPQLLRNLELRGRREIDWVITDRPEAFLRLFKRPTSESEKVLDSLGY